MADSWFYTHEGKTHGPVSAAALTLLAAEGKLAPTDLVWGDGRSPVTAVPARAVIPFSQSAPPRAATPDWLDDVRKAEAVSDKPGVPMPPPLPPLSQEPVARPGWVEAGPELGQGRLDIGSRTSPGVVRARNEDSFLVVQATWSHADQRQEMAVVIVADGVGGHQAGERASGLVIRTMGKTLAPLLVEAVGGSWADGVLPKAIDAAFSEANRVVYETAKADAGCQGMGATTVAVVIVNDEAHIGLVGDCRVYHQRGSRLTQVTRDQTLVNRLVELGQLTPEEAANHPRRNEVTQAIGQHKTVVPVHSTTLKLRAGDWMIVACDGLPAHVEDRLLQETIGQWTASAAALAERLVEMANQRGGSDNCTVVAIRWH
jgi:protein phosphatase